MNNKGKIISSSSILIASLMTFTFLIGCNNSKSTGYNVTYHCPTGFTMYGEKDYQTTNITEISAKPSPDPHDGKKFLNWYTTKDYTSEPCSFPLKVSSNLDLYAQFVDDYKNSYVVSFSSDGGTPVPKNIVTDGDYVCASPYTTREGYTFLGWYKDIKDEVAVSFPYKPSSNINLIAKWKQNSYQPIFYTNGGDAPENTEPVEGGGYRLKNSVKKLESAPNTKKEDYNFIGWYTRDDDQGKLIKDFPYILDEYNCKMYARFEQGKYQVTLHDDDSSEPRVLKKVNTLPYAPANELVHSKPDKEFIGWKITGTDTPLTYPYSLTENIELTAIWTDKTTYKVEYVYDGKVQKEETYPKGKFLTDGYTPSKDYFDFKGWYYDSTFKKKVSFPIEINENIQIFAKFDRNAFDVAFRNPETDEIIHSMSKQTEITQIPSVTPPGREGDYRVKQYVFKGESAGEAGVTFLNLNNIVGHLEGNTVILDCIWDTEGRTYRMILDYGIYHAADYYNTQTSFQIKDLKDKKIVTSDQKVTHWLDKNGNRYNEETVINPRETGEITIYAEWEGTYRSLNVIRYLNPTEKTETQETLEHLASDAPLSALGHNEDELHRYKKVGYYKSTDGKTFESTYTPFKDDEGNDNTIYGWAAAKEAWVLEYGDVKVKNYDEKILTFEHVPETFRPFDVIKIDRPDYKISGYKYNGKVIDEDTKTEEFTLLEGNPTVEVFWKQVKFTVTYDSNFEGSTPFVVPHQSKFNKSYKKEQRAGYQSDDNWYKNKECSEVYNEDDPVTEDVTVYAKWIKSTTIVVNFNVGSTQAEAKFSDGSRVATISSLEPIYSENFPVCSCDGCKFAGWYDKEVDGTKIEGPITSSMTVYARWAPYSNYVSICLKAENGGVFDQTHTESLLFNVKKGQSFIEFKDKLTQPKYDDEFCFGHYSLTPGGEEVDYATVFNESCFLYSVDKDNVYEPTKTFEDDNWATFISVAENKNPYMHAHYDNGLEAIRGEYPNLKVGDTKQVIVNNEINNARVVGFGQDYGNLDPNNRTFLPITLDFVKLPFIECIGSIGKPADKNCIAWSRSSLRTKLDEGGYLYNLLPQCFIKNHHIPDVYKYTREYDIEGNISVDSPSKCKLFIPTSYEINASIKNMSTQGYDFVYSHYDGEFEHKDSRKILKEYRDTGVCIYHLREQAQKYNYFNFLQTLHITDDTCEWEIRYSNPSYSIGIAPFFCLGEAYTPA